ncbi:MAG: 50S ribosomal protein L20 [Candidatus Hydrogenedentota bacterium]
MPRATNTPAAKARRRKVMKMAKGFFGGRRKLLQTARIATHKAGQYSYRDRRAKKRDFRQLWITRINAATRASGLSYNRFIQGLRLANVDLNRKMLAEIAATDEAKFQQLVELARTSLTAAQS